VTAINAARKSEKNANNDNADDGIRFFLMLDAFTEFGDAVPVGKTLRNADWMTLDESRRKYQLLQEGGEGQYASFNKIQIEDGLTVIK
jgi:hypothetical protein